MQFPFLSIQKRKILLLQVFGKITSACRKEMVTMGSSIFSRLQKEGDGSLSCLYMQWFLGVQQAALPWSCLLHNIIQSSMFFHKDCDITNFGSPYYKLSGYQKNSYHSPLFRADCHRFDNSTVWIKLKTIIREFV